MVSKLDTYLRHIRYLLTFVINYYFRLNIPNSFSWVLEFRTSPHSTRPHRVLKLHISANLSYYSIRNYGMVEFMNHVYNSKEGVKSLQKCRVSASTWLLHSQFIVKFLVNSVRYSSACTTFLLTAFAESGSMYSQAQMCVECTSDYSDHWPSMTFNGLERVRTIARYINMRLVQHRLS